ncbi:hypothetical protein H5410_062308 [Solanum commersonii]|uniref:Uncharacterized protein n=1 Tax=Solanum commersonii TaxID=4109 RepID=A0A9J5WC97_SOLCO|nr:hypothetical protein H5410_062308 [Solanum commersonii]
MDELEEEDSMPYSDLLSAGGIRFGERRDEHLVSSSPFKKWKGQLWRMSPTKKLSPI